MYTYEIKMRLKAPGRFEAPSDNNQFLLEKVTWTRMGRHGKPSETERWWMPARHFPREFADCALCLGTGGEGTGEKSDRSPSKIG